MCRKLMYLAACIVVLGLVTVPTIADIGDGLEDAIVHGDPPAAREAASRMAVNILMYALTPP